MRFHGSLQEFHAPFSVLLFDQRFVGLKAGLEWQQRRTLAMGICFARALGGGYKKGFKDPVAFTDTATRKSAQSLSLNAFQTLTGEFGLFDL